MERRQKHSPLTFPLSLPNLFSWVQPECNQGILQ
jgi:hypothetical protein